MLDAFPANDRSSFARLDKELETSVGRKERIAGALRPRILRREGGDFGFLKDVVITKSEEDSRRDAMR